MEIDRRSGRRLEVEVEPFEPGVEDGVVLGRERREVIDARRERLARAGQAPLQWWCPGARQESAPGVVVSRSTCRSGLPLLGRFTAGSPRGPSRVTLPFD